MRIVGTGLPRTGTNSLKLAVERLTGRPCYHMFELMDHREHAPAWTEIARGGPTDWSFLADFGSIVDWPGAAMWDRLVDDFPDAVVVHSVRDDAEQWWRSLDRTVAATIRERREEEPGTPAREFILALVERAGWPSIDDAEAMMAHYDEHDRRVRERVEPERLVVFNPRDGWGPLAAALGLDVPDEPYPKVNTTDEYLRNV
ncbi:MAG: sulfotransferase family protein [Actinomycetota bacterium]